VPLIGPIIFYAAPSKPHMRAVLVCALFIVSACGAPGQEFEVVSVKPNKSGSNGSHSSSDQGILTGTNLNLRNFIVMAYQIKDYQLEGPDWLGSERYDIAARFPEALPKNPEKYNAALGAMMQKMLADRFKLTVHHDQKTMPVYGLVVSKKGIKFKPSTETGSRSNSNNTHYVGTVTMDRFAEFLSRRMDMPVLDMTGLQGNYDLKLDWVPESRASGDSKNAAGDNPSGPTLVDALQEQLGLKLETRKAPIEIIVVDHVEKVPTEN
jgi:uncharacterized protein (TIGR03435 family)